MSRERLLAPHRVVLIGVLLLLMTVAALASRGPSWWQRMYYPLRYRGEIEAAAIRHRINPYLIAAVIFGESSFDSDTVSGAGAVGLMQIMPDTAVELRRRGLAAKDVVEGEALADPAANIEYGTAYIRYLVDRYHEVETVLAAYNAGMGRADIWAAKGIDIRKAIEFPSTKRYVLRVVRARERYERLYPDAFPAWEG